MRNGMERGRGKAFKRAFCADSIRAAVCFHGRSFLEIVSWVLARARARAAYLQRKAAYVANPAAGDLTFP